MKWLSTLLFALVVAFSAHAQAPSAEQKVDELLKLLKDPEVQSLLAERRSTVTTAPSAAADKPKLAGWETGVRTRIDAIISAVPRIPMEIGAAATRTRQDAISHGYAPVFIIFAALVAVGLAAEWFFRKYRPRSDGVLGSLAPVAIFAATMAIIFFAVDWPPLARVSLLAYLSAFVLYRLGSVLIALALGRQRPLRLRARILLAVVIFAAANAALGAPLGVDPAVSEALSYCFSIVILVLAIEASWSTSLKPRASRAALTVFLFAVWLLWCLDLQGLFWLGIYALVLPGILRGVGQAAEEFSSGAAGSLRNVIVARGARATVITLAVAWLAFVWEMNSDGFAHNDPLVRALFYGLLKSVLVLLVADLLWQLAKSWIDRALATSTDTTALPPADAARRARFRTLLPIFRNALAVIVAVMAGLIVLSELGVQIGPLIAGAGIFGVAIGFGSQTLVKDVISGVFYMLDDAFRVGEYIQAKSYKGTVEGFSLRSVRLRHHRGPVFTVPFGELGAVENMSRDWVIDKFRINVAYDTDIEKARKIAKRIGAELAEDAELGPLFIQPLKMKGVEEFGDYGIVISFAMTTVPGMQTYIRRKAYAKIREAFQASGIEFAQPTVQVGGDDKGGGAAAASAVRVQQEKSSGVE
ncbi:mechanosensitive ion channel family protein (plasmid) [Rhizobium grahamii]|uniref:Mechanosensitive ion channel family protein n=1 Tax=Rhizobium grahamii TaxID=1120045 RepID=A0A5Q0CFX6_9HYPH|nr:MULTISPECIES: mechanosensitive ion channel family protein [Rhizobium]QFY62901.1 mechanosensitive ion channel family protein [Rhizobium grahamii]QRM52348.1 mechanosensitive ion channel family protein [Rhizobium sp. BG6]